MIGNRTILQELKFPHPCCWVCGSCEVSFENSATSSSLYWPLDLRTIIIVMIIIVNNIIIIMIIIINTIIKITIISLLCSLTNDRILLLRENDKPEEMVGLLKRVEEYAVLVEEVCPIGGCL